MELDASSIPPVPERDVPAPANGRDYVPLMVFCPDCGGWHDTIRCVRINRTQVIIQRHILLRKCARLLPDGSWCLYGV